MFARTSLIGSADSLVKDCRDLLATRPRHETPDHRTVYQRISAGGDPELYVRAILYVGEPVPQLAPLDRWDADTVYEAFELLSEQVELYMLAFEFDPSAVSAARKGGRSLSSKLRVDAIEWV